MGLRALLMGRMKITTQDEMVPGTEQENIDGNYSVHSSAGQIYQSDGLISLYEPFSDISLSA